MGAECLILVGARPPREAAILLEPSGIICFVNLEND